MDFYVSTRQIQRNQHITCQAIHQYIFETSIWSVRIIKVKLVLYESIMFTVNFTVSVIKFDSSVRTQLIIFIC